MFRKYARMVEHREREPLRLDVVTIWNSQVVKDRDVLNLTISNLTISSDFNCYVLTREYWSHIHAMEEWLEIHLQMFLSFWEDKDISHYH